MKNYLSLAFLILILNFCSSLYTQWYPQYSGTNGDSNSVFFIDKNTGWTVDVKGSAFYQLMCGNASAPDGIGTGPLSITKRMVLLK